MDNRNPAIGIIGAGVMGHGLALSLASANYSVSSVSSRSLSSARSLAEKIPGCRAYWTAQELADAADVVFITTPDSAIAMVAAGLTWHPGQGVVHCCGASSTEILRPAAVQGALTGAFHPLQTLAGVVEPADAAIRLSGVTFLVSADGWLDRFLRGLATALGGRSVSIPDTDRALYHSAAVLGCGYLAAVLQAAVEVWQELGFTPEQAIQALYPLSRATLDTVAKHGVASGVTGPVVRGDVATIQSHLEALHQALPHLAPLYGALTAASLPVAAKRGVGPDRIVDIQALIARYTGAA